MELLTIDIDFFDELAITLSGINGALPTKAVVPASAVPITGDLIRFPELKYPSGDLAFFCVKLRTYLPGHTPRIQLNLELVAAFPQLHAEESRSA